VYISLAHFQGTFLLALSITVAFQRLIEATSNLLFRGFQLDVTFMSPLKSYPTLKGCPWICGCCVGQEKWLWWRIWCAKEFSTT